MLLFLFSLEEEAAEVAQSSNWQLHDFKTARCLWKSNDHEKLRVFGLLEVFFWINPLKKTITVWPSWHVTGKINVTFDSFIHVLEDVTEFSEEKLWIINKKDFSVSCLDNDSMIQQSPDDDNKVKIWSRNQLYHNWDSQRRKKLF